MFIKKFIIGLLSFYAFEVKRSSYREDVSPYADIKTERLMETRKKKEAEKKKTRLYDKRKWKKKKQFTEKRLKIVGTNPKDARFSNQKSLRRMYRNS